jgi:UDP-N-acetylglucosamine transferase subunit ALG13
MLALSGGHSPIVVPRDPAFDEHVDDHQLRFTTWLAGRRPIIVVRSMADLGAAIETRRMDQRRGATAPYVPQQAIDRLEGIVHEIR